LFIIFLSGNNSLAYYFLGVLRRKAARGCGFLRIFRPRGQTLEKHYLFIKTNFCRPALASSEESKNLKN